jgi:hypothetical protein
MAALEEINAAKEVSQAQVPLLMQTPTSGELPPESK